VQSLKRANLRRKWSTIRKTGGRPSESLPLFEIDGVLVRFDHVARLIENANHKIM
jgi:hypothetical protein